MATPIASGQTIGSGSMRLGRNDQAADERTDALRRVAGKHQFAVGRGLAPIVTSAP